MQLAGVGNLNEVIVKRPIDPRSGRRLSIRGAGKGSGHLANWTGLASGILEGLSLSGSSEPTDVWPSGLGVFMTPARDFVIFEPNRVIGARTSGLVLQTGAHFATLLTRGRSDLSLHTSTLRPFRSEFKLEAVPYLALVRSLLEREDLEAARKMLDAMPLEVSETREARRLKKLLALPRVAVSETCDVDRTREYRWLRDHWQEYRGQWVALEGDRIAAAARSLKELRERLKALNLATPPLVHRLD